MNKELPSLRGLRLHTTLRPLGARAFAASRTLAILLAAGFLITAFVPLAANGSVFIWENNFADNAPIDGTSFPVDGITISFTQMVSSDSDFGTFDLFLDAPDHPDYVTFDAGQQGNQTGYAQFYLDNNNNDPVDYIELIMNFSSPVTALSFLLVDIDSGTNNTPEWDDFVEVYVNGATNILDLAPTVHTIVAGVPSVFDPGNEPGGYRGFEGFNGRDAETNEDFGNVSLDFASTPVSSVRVRYFSSSDAQSNPINQWVGISDLSFTVPEPATAFLLAGAAFCGVLRRRR